MRTELSRLKHSIQKLEKKKNLEEQKVSTGKRPKILKRPKFILICKLQIVTLAKVIDIVSMIDPDDPEFDLAEKIINAIFDLESNDQGEKDLKFDHKTSIFRLGSTSEYINAVKPLCRHVLIKKINIYFQKLKSSEH